MRIADPEKKKAKKNRSFAKEVGQALRRAGKAARLEAKRHGLPIYVMKDGKIKKIKP